MEFCKRLSSSDKTSNENNNKYLIFENYYDKSNNHLTLQGEYDDMMESSETLCHIGRLFVKRKFVKLSKIIYLVIIYNGTKKINYGSFNIIYFEAFYGLNIIHVIVQKFENFQGNISDDVRV